MSQPILLVTNVSTSKVHGDYPQKDRPRWAAFVLGDDLIQQANELAKEARRQFRDCSTQAAPVFWGGAEPCPGAEQAQLSVREHRTRFVELEDGSIRHVGDAFLVFEDRLATPEGEITIDSDHIPLQLLRDIVDHLKEHPIEDLGSEQAVWDAGLNGLEWSFGRTPQGSPLVCFSDRRAVQSLRNRFCKDIGDAQKEWDLLQALQIVSEQDHQEEEAAEVPR